MTFLHGHIAHHWLIKVIYCHFNTDLGLIIEITSAYIGLFLVAEFVIWRFKGTMID